jgi:hypothetical protein
MVPGQSEISAGVNAKNQREDLEEGWMGRRRGKGVTQEDLKHSKSPKPGRFGNQVSGDERGFVERGTVEWKVNVEGSTQKCPQQTLSGQSKWVWDVEGQDREEIPERNKELLPLEGG